MVVQRSQLKQELAVTINITNVAIGFHDMLSGGSVDEYPTPIKYTNVLANRGDRYDSSTGKFRADMAVFYYFEQYWAMNPNYVLALYIKKNGDSVCQGYGKSSGDNCNFICHPL